MFGAFLFKLYLVGTAFAIPLSFGLNYGASLSKSNWADAVVLVTNEYREEMCVLDSCITAFSGFGSGTAFVIDYEDDVTIFMSAAHLCNEYTIVESESKGEFETRRHSTMYIRYNNTLYPAGKMILYKNNFTDVCVFGVKGVYGKKLKIAKKDPKYSEQIWTIGAPAGFFPESAKPINSGYYSGTAYRINQVGDKQDFFNFSLPTIGGMSGSPILNSKGQVVGIVSAVFKEWHMICFSPTLTDIKEAEEIVSRLLNQKNPL